MRYDAPSSRRPAEAAVSRRARSWRRAWVRAGAAAGLLTSSLARADTVAADLQAKILLRALAYDRNLKERVGNSVTVAIVSRRGDTSAARNDIVRAFGGLAKLTFQGLPMNVVEHEYTGVEHL